MKSIVVLGSTGSVGTQTLEIVRSFPKEFRVLGLSAWNNLPLLQKQIEEFHPRMVCCRDGVDSLSLPPGCRWVLPEEMVIEPDVETVMLATVGKAGLLPCLQALRSRKNVALANKEVIVMAGELVTREAHRHNAQILPVDSEPSAIWQCLRGEDKALTHIILTASGGPFRTRPISELAHVTPEEALKHPTWQMGKKITIDSATLMNKGFEFIESKWLFDLPWDHIKVVVHPQSIIHSMVEFADGSIKAQLSLPDMRHPIQYALFYPKRVPNANLNHLDFLKGLSLTFEPLNLERYPCFSLALETSAKGGTYPAVLSAADEVAVELFLTRRICFGDISSVVQETLSSHIPTPTPSLEEILEADRWAREKAQQVARVLR